MGSETIDPSARASSPPAPVAPILVGYFTVSSATEPLQAILRAIGLLMLLVGIVRLGMIPLNFLYLSRFTVEASYPNWYRAAWVVGTIATAVLAAWTILAGSAMLRRPPRLRTWIIAWAWASIAFTVYAACMNLLQMLYINQMGIWGISSVAYQFTERLSSLLVPIIVMILLARPEMRKLFEPHH